MSRARSAAPSSLDPISGLPDRGRFVQLLAAMPQPARQDAIGALLLIGFDHFAEATNTLGPLAAREVIAECASRLEALSVPAADGNAPIVGRIGPETFAVACADFVSAQDVHDLARRISAALTRPFITHGYELVCSCSIGMTLFEGMPSDAARLIEQADRALYGVQHGAEPSPALYAPAAMPPGTGTNVARADGYDAIAEHPRLAAQLRHALARRQFSLNLQPQLSLTDGRIVGYEFLLRWSSPELGGVAPAEFLPILEQTGDIREVGHWVLDSAAQMLAGLLREESERAGRNSRHQPGVHAAVNLSVAQLLDPQLSDVVRDIAARHAVPTTRLVFEISEHTLHRANGSAQKAVEALHACGARGGGRLWSHRAQPRLPGNVPARSGQARPGDRQRSDQRERSRGAATPGDCRAWCGRARHRHARGNRRTAPCLAGLPVRRDPGLFARNRFLPAGSTTHKT